MLYKVLGKTGMSINGGFATWLMPNDDGTPGGWMPDRKVEPCVSGYHLTSAYDLKDWLPHYDTEFTLFEAEGKGKRVDAGNKVVFESARLIRRIDLDLKKAREVLDRCRAYNNKRRMPSHMRSCVSSVRSALMDATWEIFHHPGPDNLTNLATLARDAAWEARSKITGEVWRSRRSTDPDLKSVADAWEKAYSTWIATIYALQDLDAIQSKRTFEKIFEDCINS